MFWQPEPRDEDENREDLNITEEQVDRNFPIALIAYFPRGAETITQLPLHTMRTSEVYPITPASEEMAAPVMLCCIHGAEGINQLRFGIAIKAEDGNVIFFHQTIVNERDTWDIGNGDSMNDFHFDDQHARVTPFVEGGVDRAYVMHVQPQVLEHLDAALDSLGLNRVPDDIDIEMHGPG